MSPFVRLARSGRPSLFLLLVLCALCLPGCQGNPIAIGFLGPLQGKYSDLGVQGRNGAMLAVEEINAEGGVAGRPLLLTAVDDANDEAKAVAAIRTLGRQEVTAVIGPMTSVVAVTVLPLAAEEGLTLISPTVSSPYLSGKKDNFYRLTPDTPHECAALARFALTKRGVRDVAVITDLANAAYTVPCADNFISELHAAGGRVLADIRLNSAAVGDWKPTAAELARLGPDAVFGVLSGRDFASLARDLHHQGTRTLLLGSMWSATQELLQTGGLSVEGALFSLNYDDNNPLPRFQAFKQRFERRFGTPPSFAACFSYEAVMVLARALEWTRGSRNGLPEALSALGKVEGVQSPLVFDEYGDVSRRGFIVEVKDGGFKTLESIEP
ncbi:extracellular ligand-binding receptor [Desulfovibrio sp. X2]|uniref:ABC transporter substrate-binding protein n=1 Tax=Desulfovibrio sp. X2 TaxID=941449 RepID=UPI000358833E|nr:ABC transporter substrate-binding protein [Desulfovibrio sp. X2]EPR40873.1 extracellular ligand-binding receptor [Desulfovibrio sp. X2]